MGEVNELDVGMAEYCGSLKILYYLKEKKLIPFRKQPLDSA
ncbi:hypothetical protein HacjB3_09700 [Halalkalicoccus jeotgali B3]|uniref:Uncharacterized protein n=1 Tax=Halalkalicoccus jeotgali (strain DSM 18796 / CECT 7217 / JCM 14584 / KCTC 4019 / B3) TaxID=795797 RepID=D8J3L6_HALJB|nr:hypothetical protein HacjB3_09700 [Halalkalicoccus jeotgali B3]